MFRRREAQKKKNTDTHSRRPLQLVPVCVCVCHCRTPVQYQFDCDGEQLSLCVCVCLCVSQFPRNFQLKDKIFYCFFPFYCRVVSFRSVNIHADFCLDGCHRRRLPSYHLLSFGLSSTTTVIKVEWAHRRPEWLRRMQSPQSESSVSNSNSTTSATISVTIRYRAVPWETVRGGQFENRKKLVFHSSNV